MPARRDGLGGVEDFLGLLFVDFPRPDSEHDREVADLLVAAEQFSVTFPAQRAGGGVDVGQRFQPFAGCGDRGRVLRIGQLFALGRDQHQRVAAVGLFGQVVFQQFGRDRRVGAGQGQVFAGLAAGRLADQDEGDREHDPDPDHGPVVARAEPADRVEGPGHRAIIAYGAGVVPFSNADGTSFSGLAPSSRRSSARCWAWLATVAASRARGEPNSSRPIAPISSSIVALSIS